MFHIEMRQLPYNACHFNLSPDELRVLVEPWVRGQVIEVSDRRWRPDEATMTIIEGPELALHELKLGRGWRNAERVGKDVTRQIIAEAREVVHEQELAAAAPPPASAAPDPLSGDLAELLGQDAAWLLVAWRASAASSSGLAPSESLALAEQAVRSSRGS